MNRNIEMKARVACILLAQIPPRLSRAYPPDAAAATYSVRASSPHTNTDG